MGTLRLENCNIVNLFGRLSMCNVKDTKQSKYVYMYVYKKQKCEGKPQNTTHGLAKTSRMRTTNHPGSGSHGQLFRPC